MKIVISRNISEDGKTKSIVFSQELDGDREEIVSFILSENNPEKNLDEVYDLIIKNIEDIEILNEVEVDDDIVYQLAEVFKSSMEKEIENIRWQMENDLNPTV